MVTRQSIRYNQSTTNPNWKSSKYSFNFSAANSIAQENTYIDCNTDNSRKHPDSMTEIPL